VPISGLLSQYRIGGFGYNGVFDLIGFEYFHIIFQLFIYFGK